MMPAQPLLGRRARWTLVTAQLAITATYLVWRAGWTLDTSTPWYAAAFFAAELVLAVFGIGFYLTIVDRAAARVAPAPAPGVTVDVLIATYNEDVELLRTTAIAARDMEHPHRTVLCDDGRRPQVERLARELGIEYLTRPSNAHYKAGNLNHALRRTDGELVVVLDADHVPRREFLTRLVGHFADPRVALVQTPQVPYNVDSYQHARRRRGAALWDEGAIFHHALQPGLDRVNAAFFIGSGAVLRRSALERVGGIAEGTITEDVLTSMRLHAAGFRSVYVDEPLAYLLAADTPQAYATQRLRWAQGAMTILRTENPLTKRGLSLPQRLAYLQSLGTYLSALPNLLFYLAPALFVFFGLSPLRFDAPVTTAVIAAYLVFSLAVYRLLAHPYGSLLHAECYKLLNLPIFLRAFEAFVRPRPRPFVVTPKGAHGGRPPLLVVAPLAGLCLLNASAVALAVTRLGEAADTAPLIMNIAFAGFFAIAGTLALLHTFDRSATEEPFAFVAGFDARADQTPVTVARLSHDFAYVTPSTEARIGKPLALDLRSAGLATPVTAVLIERGRRGDKLALQGLSRDERDLLDRFFFGTAVAAPADALLPLRSSILAPLSLAQGLRSAAVVVALFGVARATVGAPSALAIAAASPPAPVAFSLADRDRWSVSDGFHAGAPFAAGWRKEQVLFSERGATLRVDGSGCPTACAGRSYAAAELRSRERHGYGRVEGRLRAARGSGLVTSLFVYTGPSDGAPWDEIDIEILGRDTTVLQTNYITGGAGGHETLIPLGFDAADGFHTYAFEWTPGEIRWYVDGKLVHRETGTRGPLPTHPGRVMANVWPAEGVDAWAGRFLGAPAQAEYAAIAYRPL